MTLEQALSHSAHTTVLEADEPHYRSVFRQVLACLQAVAGRVEESEPGTAFVDMDGLEALYDGEGRLVGALLNALPRDLQARVGVGDGKFPALMAARASRPLEAAWIPPDAAAFVAPCSVDLLPLPPETRAGLHLFGLHTMGDVAAMGKDRLVDQFGLAGRRAWRLSNGVDDSRLIPFAHQESVVEHISLPYSSASLEVLLAAADILVERAYSRPRMRNRNAGRAALECALADAPAWEKSIHFKQGIGNRAQASFVIRSQLEADHPQAPMEELTLTLADLAAESGEQMSLLGGVRQGRQRRLVELAKRLHAKMSGSHVLHRVAPVALWHPVPEMRALQVPIDPAGADSVKPLCLPVAVKVREGADHQPAAVRFGDRWHQVASVEETWSFDLWWHPRPLARSYYRVSGKDGRQVTLFRDRRQDQWFRQCS